MKLLFISVFIIITFVSSFAQNSVLFHVNDPLKQDLVTFTSKAPLETIVGKTAEISGYIDVDPTDIQGSAKAILRVDLSTLKTGINMRDKDMKEKFLETNKYRYAVFELEKIVKSSSNELRENQAAELICSGNFTVHGVTKPITITITAVYIPQNKGEDDKAKGGALHIKGTFDVLLSDHNIERPKFIILKLDDKQVINLDFYASTAAQPASLKDD